MHLFTQCFLFYRLRNGVKYCKVLRLPEVRFSFLFSFYFFFLAQHFLSVDNTSVSFAICCIMPSLISLFCPVFAAQILCIHLKRFRHEVMYSFKISSHVSFPLEGLDMRPFLAKESPSQVTTYDLLSVICHHGTAGSMRPQSFLLIYYFPHGQYFSQSEQNTYPISICL